MRPEEAKYIAHIRSSDKHEQTVAEHNSGTAALAGLIGAEYGMKHLSSLSGGHHDDGKNTPEYYAYIKAVSEGEKVVRGSVIHSTYGARIANELTKESDISSRLAAEMIRIAIMSHHGLRDAISKDGVLIYQQATEHIEHSYEAVERIVYENHSREDTEKEFLQARTEAEQIQSRIKELNSKKSGLGSAHIYLAFYVRLLTSILIDADRTDTACFEDNIKPAKRLDARELRKLWHGYRNYCDGQIQKMQLEKEPSPLDKYRAEISEACARFDGGASGIFRLVVPCGAGKTLSALRYALQTAERYGKRHIFYIAPYNSILEQNAGEIAKYIGDDEAVLRHHSNIVFDEDDGDELKRYQLLAENWARSPIIATSAVQFLNTLFAAKTSAVRRMQALGESVVIVDEIQAFPIKTLKLFNAAMNFLAGFCGTSILLCSATQPLLDEIKEYKIIAPSNLIQDEDRYREVFRRVVIEDDTKGNGYTYAEAADCIFMKAQAVKSLLAVVNTKAAARAIAKRIKEIAGTDDGYQIYHLSTNMCQAHREAVIHEMRASLSDKNNKCKIICISTNLIEAGVDISFERVVRSLTGLDSIIQAAGRCNRNHETACGTVSVIYIRDERTEALSNIKDAQEATREVLYSIQCKPEIYPEGALSKRAMDAFYTKYYIRLQNEMAFPLKNDPERTIIDLLTTNSSESKRCKASGNILLKQAFKEAGDAFAVIEDIGKKDVIVAFNDDARKHIKALLNCRLVSEQKKELRYLQQYTVQLLPYTIERIGAGIQTEMKLA